MSKTVVIGGGPAGLMSAISAASRGAHVTILEKGSRPGRKLDITGKGRCNVTNTADREAFIRAFEPKGRFLYGAFSRFFSEDIIALLESEGVETKVERGGRVFPVSDRASDVTDALIRHAQSLGVRIKTNASAKSLVIEDSAVKGVNLYGGRFDCAAVVLATGGVSYPKTGSTGDGYEMAKQAGHEIVPPTAALSALFVKNPIPEIAGLSLKNAEVSLIVEGAKKPARKEFGEMLFTHKGLSGPVILTLSRSVGRLGGKPAAVSIDLKPALTPEQLDARLLREFAKPRKMKSVFAALLPKSLANMFGALCDVSPEKSTAQVTTAERKRIIEKLKSLTFDIKSLAPVEEAIVTSGGVALTEIDPKTMGSKLVRGLYFAGEIIDIDAETGGYNLQAAFSTGYAAGRAAADYLSTEDI
ncbi:MAG: NAD(P)/FAD-dependent oxidoreductase [Abditibacteriota bacterium]|nr:NAD(P)/FAD-dependent oxidoreductase [Abditibacteriota bacterium]